MGRFIPDEVIDQIRVRADIVDVIQNYVPQLKKNGRNFVACCPFHQEKTPSFHINAERQSYHCFGCGKGGNVFTFVMEMERLDFPNAAEQLARKYNVIIPEPEPWRGGFKGKTTSTADYNLRERLFLLHEQLATWYVRQLKEKPDTAVARYLTTRKIPQEFVNHFMLGASPDSWDETLSWAKKEGFTDEELRQSGVVIDRDSGSGFYDRFRNRLMFPIWNEQGRIVAFSSRTVEKDSQGAKYINSPESPIFKKGRTLYALHFARIPIRDTGYAVLCEGQIDVIAMHRAGCSMAVAPQGTAFGTEQATILKRYTQNIRLALDNDEAGKKAVFKDASILLPMGFLLKVVVYPGAKDADELLSAHGEEAVRNAVEYAVDFFEFAYDFFALGKDLTHPAEKAQLAEKMAELILLLDNPVTQDAYLSWLAKKLSLSKDSLSLELMRRKQLAERRNEFQLKRELQREQEERKNRESPKKCYVSDANPRLKQAMIELFEAILAERQYAESAESEIEPDMLDGSPLALAIETVIQTKHTGDWEDSAQKIFKVFEQQNLSAPEVTAILTNGSCNISTIVRTESLQPEDDDTVNTSQVKAKLAAEKKQRLRKQFRDSMCIIQEIYYRSECVNLIKAITGSTSSSEREELEKRFRHFSELNRRCLQLNSNAKKTDP